MSAGLTLADTFIRAARAVGTPGELSSLVDAATREMGFRYHALVHHTDLRTPDANAVDLKHYPAAIIERLVVEQRYRRDPVVRACFFAGAAFLWSDLPTIIRLDRRDVAALKMGAGEGLNEGITVPFVRLGDPLGSCTFAGTPAPEQAERQLGTAQMIGIFAFQAARRLLGAGDLPQSPRLHPRPRDCIVLAGRGLSNKEIARALDLTPRTVDGYMTEARRLFDAHDRTELVASALLAGEIDLHELRRRQPE